MINKRKNLKIYNVCDAEPYEFNRIIEVFKKSGFRPNRPIISIPLFPIWLISRIAGLLFSNKRNWIYSCYNKLAYDLVFDNGSIMDSGFKPRHSLETIFFRNSRKYEQKTQDGLNYGGYISRMKSQQTQNKLAQNE